MDTARFTMAGALALGLITFSQPVLAQDRGVSIPDVFTPHPGDAFVAQQVTTALRTAGGMTENWRTSTVDVPLAELMRACGASLTVDPEPACMARMVVTLDPSMTGGLVVFAFMNRVGEDNGFNLALALYDMQTSESVMQIEVTVDRIMAPAARNRLAAEWIRRLTAPPPVVAVADPPPDIREPEPVPDPEPVAEPVPETRRVTDTTVTDTVGWILVGTAIASAIGAGITGGLLLNLNEDARYNEYRGSWDASRVANICEAAAMDPSDDGRYALDVCNQGQTLEIVTHVLWAATGVFAIAGAVFIIWHPGAPTNEVALTARLTPVLGPTQAGLDLTVEF